MHCTCQRLFSSALLRWGQPPPSTVWPPSSANICSSHGRNSPEWWKLHGAASEVAGREGQYVMHPRAANPVVSSSQHTRASSLSHTGRSLSPPLVPAFCRIYRNDPRKVNYLDKRLESFSICRALCQGALGCSRPLVENELVFACCPSPHLQGIWNHILEYLNCLVQSVCK